MHQRHVSLYFSPDLFLLSSSLPSPLSLSLSLSLNLSLSLFSLRDERSLPLREKRDRDISREGQKRGRESWSGERECLSGGDDEGDSDEGGGDECGGPSALDRVRLL